MTNLLYKSNIRNCNNNINIRLKRHTFKNNSTSLISLHKYYISIFSTIYLLKVAGGESKEMKK